ncbi:hypothetical protein V2W45_1521162 [Cenococcum geophilum]
MTLNTAPAPAIACGYTLSFERERSLAGTLAFLSNITDASLGVLLAGNKVKQHDGNQVLQKLKQGLERIFANDVFDAIISMCSARILCHLRFVSNNRKTPKQSIKKLKDKKLRELCLIAKLFVKRAKELRVLVEGVYRLWQVELHALLGAIPNRAMGPSSRGNLVNIVGKVTRYREAARFLYRTAKKFPLVQQMKIVVDLPQDAFYEIPANQYTPTLPSTISRLSTHHICRLLNITELEASNKFAQQTSKTLKEAKIHAEIQLLFLPNRTIKDENSLVCSSKDACFLCNAFIITHGKMHTPRSHGRLARFNQALENYVRNSLRTLLSRQWKTAYPDPNESTLLCTCK